MTKKKPGAEMGRPEFAPTDKMRGEATALSVAGFTQGQIAEYLGIDDKTLRHHFRAELDASLMKVLARCASNVVMLANGADATYDKDGKLLRPAVSMDLGANCFILKTRGKHLGWSERLEVTGKDGDAIKHRHEVVDEVAALIAEEGKNVGPPATKH